MTNISSTNNLGALTALRGAQHRQHGAHGAAELADRLFSKLDTGGQGFVKKADIEAALNDGSQAAKSVNSGDIDALFSGFDSDGDGKLTKQEFTDSVKRLADQLTQQLRLRDAQNAANGNGLVPPAPPEGANKGFTKDELGSQLQAIGDVDGKRGNLLNSLVQNFEQADGNGDGRIDVQEAVNFARNGSATAGLASTVSTSDGNAANSSAASNDEAKMMQQLMKLLETYGANDQEQRRHASALQAVTA